MPNSGPVKKNTDKFENFARGCYADRASRKSLPPNDIIKKPGKSSPCDEFSGVGKLSSDWFDDESTSNRPRTREDTYWLAVHDCLDSLQIWLEFALGHARRLDADSSEVLRLSASRNSMS